MVVYSLSSFKWLQILAGNRPIDPYNPNDGVELTDINDMRNGMTVTLNAHGSMGLTKVAVLVVGFVTSFTVDRF